MTRNYLGVIASAFLMACATTSPGVVETASADGNAMTCAVGVLSDRGYELRSAGREALTLEAEVRRDQSPLGAVREIITTSLDQASTPVALTVAARAWQYQPALHNLPVNRQTVTEIRPSAEAAADARLVLSTCGRENGAAVGHVQTSSAPPLRQGS